VGDLVENDVEVIRHPAQARSRTKAHLTIFVDNLSGAADYATPFGHADFFTETFLRAEKTGSRCD
jgi:hypothetical protein